MSLPFFQEIICWVYSFVRLSACLCHCGERSKRRVKNTNRVRPARTRWLHQVYFNVRVAEALTVRRLARCCRTRHISHTNTREKQIVRAGKESRMSRWQRVVDVNGGSRTLRTFQRQPVRRAHLQSGNLHAARYPRTRWGGSRTSGLGSQGRGVVLVRLGPVPRRC
ncbi:hypothetical protein CC80DRAFT_137360 [Byssothecium circinans]|uniref:Secreted protein n=1 Tax=Byssothecium circinans TaxID=147558 RepID=A0A6A5TMT8_9PLEO|nr:hypothetical protein CC80DRAFT_137360 [Byssothecium circinans]